MSDPSHLLSPRQVAQAAQIACLLEVCAPKPGNVNRHADFEDTSFEDFVLSATAIGPAIEMASTVPVGQAVLRAVKDTRALVDTNTNLGMILLLVPLSKAYYRLGAAQQRNGETSFPPATLPPPCAGRPGKGIHRAERVQARRSLRKELRAVLGTLTVADTRQVYAAIRMARPGGLGQVKEEDVNREPTLPLQQAMALAQERDTIASEYCTAFAVTFEIGLPALMAARRAGATLPTAIVQTFLTLLAHVPDTLIRRKLGIEAARRVSDRARQVLELGGAMTERGREALRQLDGELRDPHHTLNPGTTADLTAAAIFAALLQEGFPFLHADAITRRPGCISVWGRGGGGPA